jgi:hypothetical protein
MKNKNVAFLLLLALSLAAFGSGSSVFGQQTSSKLTEKQVRTLIATARTPEDRQKIAAYHRAKADVKDGADLSVKELKIR